MNLIYLCSLQLSEFPLICSLIFHQVSCSGWPWVCCLVRASCAGQAVQILFPDTFCSWLFLFTEGRNTISMTFLGLCIYVIDTGFFLPYLLIASLLIFMSLCASALFLSVAVWAMLCCLVPLYTSSYWKPLIQLSVSFVSFAFSAFVFASGHFSPLLLIFSFLYMYSYRMLTASFLNLFCWLFLKDFILCIFYKRSPNPS